ncbi:hypothetical protein PHK61_29855 [Actinomycetospora lutea]|uniref:hypothetical protein n=1 Tax=Actinomycetospora lutea TaxID=663604 RepID=UPI0023671469|nr:hypothetical protein [Actinomycetospora lutea]MDD7942625.1 hypothetical protein [Actinomycetospora lutea]
MSIELDKRLAAEGTKFLLFPQPRFLTSSGAPLFPEPETVTVSTPPATILPGPADERMYVVDAKFKLPYESGLGGPPFDGEVHPPVTAGSDGHFTHLNPDSRDFAPATMYATVRRVLDIWEDYFGHEIPWHFEAAFARLEMIPLIEWDNAQSGFGFLEFGFGRTPNGTIDHDRPYCENFDVLAHELGHSIIFSQVGVPQNPSDRGIDYGGFHESAGDLTAIVALLHFDTFVDKLLAETKGNLLTVNGLDRVGELSDARQIRVALNAKRMSDVGAEPHERSLPLTGAIFDTMVELFQQDLVDHKLISAELRERSTNTPAGPGDLRAIAQEFAAAYEGNEEEFKASLLKARDQMGKLLAATWSRLSPDFMTYHDVFAGLVAADRAIAAGEHGKIIRECFAWRRIDLLPRTAQLFRRSLDDCGLRPAAIPTSL